ncbi:MAG: hypothetical protein P8J35_05375 [Candidatus Marinimicrobia bacterium]|nr:hypothetical protein [Candidatus Neomarinimicrobiota bacterium]
MPQDDKLILEEDLLIALEASKNAGEIIMKYYRHDYESRKKAIIILSPLQIMKQMII